MDLLGFSNLMKTRARNLGKEVHGVVKDVSKAYVFTVADLTPVDTGAAVSNWQVGINVSPSGVLRPHIPGRFRSTAIENFNATIGKAFEIIDGSSPGSEVHIVNNIHYIKDLDDGTSTQAPSGMTAIAELVSLRVLLTAKVVNPR